jgi:hypothetical protein
LSCGPRAPLPAAAAPVPHVQPNVHNAEDHHLPHVRPRVLERRKQASQQRARQLRHQLAGRQPRSRALRAADGGAECVAVDCGAAAGRGARARGAAGRCQHPDTRARLRLVDTERGPLPHGAFDNPMRCLRPRASTARLCAPHTSRRPPRWAASAAAPPASGRAARRRRAPPAPGGLRR